MTELGIVIDFKFVQYSKARISITVIESDRVIDVKPEQLLKAFPPILFIDEGSVACVKFLQLKKAQSPIEQTVYLMPECVTVEGMLHVPLYLSGLALKLPP